MSVPPIMLSFNVKPSDKLIKDYYAILGQYGQLHVDHEMESCVLLGCITAEGIGSGCNVGVEWGRENISLKKMFNFGD
jgi:hypothetical protein